MTDTTPATLPPPPPPRKEPPKAKPLAPPQLKEIDVYAAIMLASSDFGDLNKDAVNPYFKAKYLSLGALLKAVREPLQMQGVVITSAFVQSGQQFVVETTLHHVQSKTEVSSTFPVLDMSSPQKVGSCATYAMRYNLLQLLGIAPEDDDGNSVSIPQPGQFMGPVPGGTERQAPVQMPHADMQPPAWL